MKPLILSLVATVIFAATGLPALADRAATTNTLTDGQHTAHVQGRKRTRRHRTKKVGHHARKQSVRGAARKETDGLQL